MHDVDYIVLYEKKKQEDVICINNMFSNAESILSCYNINEYNKNMSNISNLIEKNNIKQLIFLGIEEGRDKLFVEISNKYPDIKIKVICNTQDSLLYDDTERNNFLKLLDLSKKGIVYDIAFLRKGQYETYRELGYKCSFLMENYILDNECISNVNDIENNKNVEKDKEEEIIIGIYPLEYKWEKNIFNQFSISRFIENSKTRYIEVNERITEFLDKMKIEKEAVKFQSINEKFLISELIKSDINIECSFTEYFHLIFFISMELGIPCLLGNTSDLFIESIKINEEETYIENIEKLETYIVTDTEDNPLYNSEKVKVIIDKKEEIMKLYKEWKEAYNKISDDNKMKFINK